VSVLAAPGRPRRWGGAGDADREAARQGALFGGEALVTPRAPLTRPDPAAPALEPPRPEPGEPAAEALPTGDLQPSRSASVALDGPSLDDVISRMWESLAAGVAATCPVCQGKMASSLGDEAGGRCGSCASALD
jgi:hypothetical protein